jgi:hypothetical protein
MAINFVQGQVAVSDPVPNGPNANSNDKTTHTKVVKLTSANFTTTNTDTLVAVLPADATILSFRLWVKTQLSGGSVSAATLALGSASGGAQFMVANAAAFGAAGVSTWLTPILGIMQNYNPPYGTDIQIWARGGATTGNPTGGEMYLTVEFVR